MDDGVLHNGIRGTMSFFSCWREGRCKKTQPLLQSTQPATNTKYLHKKCLRNLVPLATETQKTRLLNKIKMYFQDIWNK